MIRIVFMGSPDFAVPILRRLARQYEIVGVVTQPDREAGRGRALKPPSVKLAALQLNLPVIQPEKIRAPEAMAQLRLWAPDLIVVAAFGQILRAEVLALPAHGSVNVHASLLPRWRGAAPIQAAIAAGDTETGVSIMKMDEGVDTGGVLSQRRIPVEPEETGGSLSERLSKLAADLLSETLPAYLSGMLQPQPQDSALASHAPMLKTEDGRLDFGASAATLARRVRAFQPWPGTFLVWNEARLKVRRAHSESGEAAPGERLVCRGQVAVGTGNGLLILDEVQPAGKKPMDGRTFLMGARVWIS
jgi:methionyl-tRNA formyltransferase